MLLASKPKPFKKKRKGKGKPLGVARAPPPRDEPLHGQDKPARQEPVSSVACFNCGCSGYYRSECPKPPRCFTCKMAGHDAIDCPTRPHLFEMQLLGFIVSDQSFYNIELEEDMAPKPKNLAFIMVLSGVTNAPTIEAELRHLMDEN